MSLNYRKNDGHNSNDSFWTSYSDLFLGLSCIFLLLYVVSSMRQGADVIKQQVQNESLTMEVNDLKNQLKAYEDIKNQYMKEKASESEKNEYNELIDKLTLLKEENLSENEKLKKALIANESKVESLNKYQQMVRNILNANKLAKQKITTRENVIEEKNQTISEKDKVVDNLEKEINQNKKIITEHEKEIQLSKEKLNERLLQLKKAFKSNNLSKILYEKKIAEANKNANEKIKGLINEKKQFENKLSDVSSKLNEVNDNLAQAEKGLNEKSAELNATKVQLANLSKDAENKINQLKENFQNEQANERKKFEGELNKLKIGSNERAKKEAEFRKEVANKERDHDLKMKGLQGQLERAQAEIDARKSVAKDIKNRFSNAGVKAEVNDETGEVLLDFGESYFDSGSAQLKREMKSVIEKAIPVYAKSLLGNQKIAEKISSVEIIGFASPTYKGKFVDPKSTKKEDQDALKYNMDLSYSRAKSIFNYMIDNQSIQTQDQKDLMALMKVSGRSFLEVAKVNKNSAPEDFCKVNDCKKAQRVVIRFNMDQSKK